MSAYKLLIHSARQVVQVTANRERFLKGKNMASIAILEGDPEGYSIVVANDGTIATVDTNHAVQQLLGENVTYDRVIDASGKSIVPGLIDGHTHPVWAGDRVHEFSLKLAGASYMDIHKAGGGIGFTVEHTRNASEDELFDLLQQRLLQMIKSGTTMAEAKSGYGLNAESEVKLLRVLNRAAKSLPIELSITFCGAHSIPKGMTAAEATANVVFQQLPHIQRFMKNENLVVDNIDVFCEEGVFDVEQTRQILQAGRQAGMQINFHGDELHPMQAAEMGASLNAEAISHLEEISDDGIKAMAESESVAVVLPTTAYILRLKPPPVRKMIEAGVPVALGTDFNPNAYCLSMPLAMHLACVLFRMSLSEALAAGTINAAASLGKASTHGSIEVGKFADILVLNAPRWEHLVYQMANHDQVIQFVIKRGEVVYFTTK